MPAEENDVQEQTDPLIAHIERHLGEMARGWNIRPGMSVCLFERCPFPDVVTYATLGMSRHVLHMDDGREVRMELVLSVTDAFADPDRAKLLGYLAEQVLETHHAPLRGEVIVLGSPVAPGSGCRALLVAPAAMLPDSFHLYEGTDPPTVFAGLIPIHADEADFIAEHGWSAFEGLLEHTEEDWCSLDRASIVTSS